MTYKTLLPFVIFAAVVSTARADGAADRWNRIAPHFTPPPEYAGKLGDYRSPLLFNDGSPVKTPADWQRRRREILDHWHGVMGAWPALIENPKVETVQSTRRENFTQHKVRVEIAKGQAADGYLLVPDGKGPFPAVFVPFYEPETSTGQNDKKLRAFAYDLTKRGFVTLSIGSPGGDARKPDTAGNVLQPLSYLAYVAANCCNALANLPQVDPKRIGVVGHSYGGKWAMFASCLCEKFAAAAWSDGGVVWDESRSNVNYWEPWYLGLDPERTRQPGIPNAENPRTGAYQHMIERGYDLHELHALIAPRPFLVSGGAEDQPARWIPLNHLVGLNRLLGFTNCVAMTNRTNHDPNEGSNARLYAFFEHFLKYGTRTGPQPNSPSRQ